MKLYNILNIDMLLYNKGMYNEDDIYKCTECRHTILGYSIKTNYNYNKYYNITQCCTIEKILNNR